MSDIRKATRGRPALISRDKIAQTALDIGLRNITVAGVAKHLGVDHSSLYGHIKGRNDLIMAAADLAIRDLDWQSDPADWRTYLTVMATAIWQMYRTTPALAGIFQSPAVMPQSGTNAFCTAVMALTSAGFNEDQTILAVNSIIDMTTESASFLDHLEADGPRPPVFQVWQEFGQQDPDRCRIMTKSAEARSTHVGVHHPTAVQRLSSGCALLPFQHVRCRLTASPQTAPRAQTARG
jgi:AcrR family transcriptional regulator